MHVSLIAFLLTAGADLCSIQKLYLMSHHQTCAIVVCCDTHCMILVNNQLDTLFFNVFIHFTSLHVSSNPVLIIRRIELYQYILWYISLSVGDCLVCRYDRHTRQSDDVLIQFDSPDDEHWVARNLQRSEINTLTKVRQVGY